MPVEACCTALNERHVGRQAHFIDMPPRIEIVQRIEDECKGLKPVDIKLRVFDVGMVCLNRDVRVEFGCTLFCDLSFPKVSEDLTGE